MSVNNSIECFLIDEKVIGISDVTACIFDNRFSVAYLFDILIHGGLSLTCLRLEY